MQHPKRRVSLGANLMALLEMCQRWSLPFAECVHGAWQGRTQAICVTIRKWLIQHLRLFGSQVGEAGGKEQHWLWTDVNFNSWFC